ncbi:hypothetical protein AJ80_05915 [Polytolypa hystricis UAMH7299]|uniref:MalT-like TPR region domain-containing protein n=1 Tax=Polytolypa hystricis (strain UAMH7299) TaxID=1447883 RepID=A0A2B7XZL8_POLH7|nr:hypothetical protein AJ80_05915 [Polytolypa hystricis UAMH7299]
MRERQDETQTGQHWKLASSILALSHFGCRTWMPYHTQLRPHLQSILATNAKRHREFAPNSKLANIQTLFHCGWLLRYSRDDPGLKNLLQHMFRELGADPMCPTADLLPLYELLSQNLNHLGRCKEAVTVLENIVVIQWKNLPSRLASEHELARAYHENGQPRQAAKLLENVVEVRETLPEDDPCRLASQHELAHIYRANGQFVEAVRLLKHIVSVGETTLTENHPDRLASEHELACAYRENGQPKEAVQLLERVVCVGERTFSDDHPDRLASEHELAAAYHAEGKVKKAVQLLEHVHELARVYRADKQVKRAPQLLEQVVRIGDESLNEEHPDRLASERGELARAYLSAGQTSRAVTILERVAKIREKTLDEDHPSRVEAKHDLLSAYKAQADEQLGKNGLNTATPKERYLDPPAEQCNSKKKAHQARKSVRVALKANVRKAARYTMFRWRL